MAILYKHDGSMITVTPENDATGFTLDELHALIDADILDFRPWDRDRVMVCDDVGLLQNEPKINLAASLLWWALGGDERYPLAGNILVAKRSEVR
jgi:hypothetical protein